MKENKLLNTKHGINGLVHTKIKCKIKGCRCCLMNLRIFSYRQELTASFHCVKCRAIRAIVYDCPTGSSSCQSAYVTFLKETMETASAYTGAGGVCGISRSAHDSTGTPSAQPVTGPL